MDHYIDIQLKPDAEMKEAELSSKVYAKFHKALCDLSTNQIGISFPLVDLKPGKLFRVHGIVSLLKELQAQSWLGGLTGYCKVSEIKEVPANTKYRVISQKKGNMSSAKLRRLISRGTMDEAAIKRYKVKMLSQGFDNPYLDIYSNSTKQNRRMFFEVSGLQDTEVQGHFDRFGLSKTATVPWF